MAPFSFPSALKTKESQTLLGVWLSARATSDNTAVLLARRSLGVEVGEGRREEEGREAEGGRSEGEREGGRNKG